MRYASKDDLLEAIDKEYTAFLALLDEFSPEECKLPGVWGDDWTISDLLAHISTWHEMFLGWHRVGIAGGKPDMPATGYKWTETPRLNQDIWARHRGRPWEDVRKDFGRTAAAVLELTEELSQEELLAAGHFAWTGKKPLTTYLGASTASHYRFGVKVLKRWKRERASANDIPETH